MTEERIQRRCCVCGARLPGLTAQELCNLGAGTIMADGSVIYHCIGGRHTAEQIRDSQSGVPQFCRASELK
jgi:hypothetical protein